MTSTTTTMKLTWLLFDFDNTLVDFEAASKKAFWLTFQQFERSCDESIYRTYQQINRQVWKDFESNKITAKLLRTQRFELLFKILGETIISPTLFGQQYLENLVKKSELYDGVIPLLQSLKENYKLSLITNGLREVQRRRLQRLHILTYFDSIVVSDEIGVAKPNINYFKYVYNSIAFPPAKEQILIVGDSLSSDILGGQNFGIHTCWVSGGKANTTNIIPDYQIDAVVELPALLQEIKEA